MLYPFSRWSPLGLTYECGRFPSPVTVFCIMSRPGVQISDLIITEEVNFGAVHHDAIPHGTAPPPAATSSASQLTANHGDALPRLTEATDCRLSTTDQASSPIDNSGELSVETSAGCFSNTNIDGTAVHSQFGSSTAINPRLIANGEKHGTTPCICIITDC